MRIAVWTCVLAMCVASARSDSPAKPTVKEKDKKAGHASMDATTADAKPGTTAKSLYIYDTNGKLLETIEIPKDKVTKSIETLAKDLVKEDCKSPVATPPNCVTCEDGRVICNGPRSRTGL